MYFYHGYALGVASTAPGNVFTQGTCALSVGGGEDSRSENKSVSPLVSFDSIKSHVSGEELHPFGEDCLDVYQTEAEVVIENLKIKEATGKERITAASVRAHILSQYRSGDYEASTVVCGSKFESLKVDGKELKPAWSNDLSQRYSTYSAMQADFKNGFSKNAECTCILGHDLKPADVTTEDLQAAYDSYQQQIISASLNPLVVCSCVQKINGDGGIKGWGSIVVVPNLGNLYLGELIVWPWMRCLTMFRLELFAGGTISGASAGTNGGGFPPGLGGSGGLGG